MIPMTTKASLTQQVGHLHDIDENVKTLRHLHFVQSLEPLQGGGLGRAAFELHESFLSRKYRSLLVTTSRDNTPQLLPKTREFRRILPDKAFFSPSLAKEADELLSTADVVHGHGFYVGTNWLFGRKSRMYGKPLVYHPHGFFEPWVLQRSRWKKRLAHLLFENKNFRSVCLWRALTPKEADQIREQGISTEIVVAPNGIRLDPFDKVAASKTPKKRKRILFLGRLHPKKGIDLLLQAWAKLAPRFSDWEIIVAGPNENSYLATLRGIVRELDLGKSVSFPGPVTGVEKVQLFKSADLFVLTSRSEGFSVAVLEAMACRVPVLITTPCNFDELSIDGGGFSCEPDAKSIERKLESALQCSDEERIERGEAGRKLVETQYTWSAISKTILDACEYHCR